MSASERFSSSATLAFANNSAYGTGGGGGGSTVGGKPVGGANGTITLFLDDLTAVWPSGNSYLSIISIALV